jgi:hypothetical protein
MNKKRNQDLLHLDLFFRTFRRRTFSTLVPRPFVFRTSEAGSFVPGAFEAGPFEVGRLVGV